ncbi:MAG: pilus assembly protein N-terminal domain-containing protein [Rhizobiaceae bacterium]|nr:pilus assembly protein N-terminal domain-containing protein [Rhizobiaceae bacterium]
MKLTLFKQIALSSAITLLASSTLITAAHSSELLRVFMNHARILKFEQPVSSVIVGNSEVADITVSDPTTVVLTGKSYGSTNLVILNDEGEAIVDKRIVVSVDEENSVRVFRQVDRSVLSCAPICEQQTN